MVFYDIEEGFCGFPYVKISGCESFDTKSIFECGQCFRWAPVKMDRKAIEKHDLDKKADKSCLEDLPENGTKGYITTAFGKCIKVFAKDGIIWILNSSIDDYMNIWSQYFDMDRSYEDVKEELMKIDIDMKKAVEMTPGLRILKQDMFETLISFIVSANNNIPRIMKIIGSLSKMAGNKIEMPESFEKEASHDDLDYSFPTPLELSKFTEDKISKATHAGYRCEYIVKSTAKFLEENPTAENLKEMSYADAFKYVTSFTGVGPKVADCTLLFTGAKDEAFPVDVWVTRVMSILYKGKVTDKSDIRKFGMEYFGQYAGIAQEYLFIYVRESGDEKFEE